MEFQKTDALAPLLQSARGASNDPLVDWRLPFKGSV
jgi:hypothetical protein